MKNAVFWDMMMLCDYCSHNYVLLHIFIIKLHSLYKCFYIYHFF
jgi:hypothetical protein